MRTDFSCVQWETMSFQLLLESSLKYRQAQNLYLKQKFKEGKRIRAKGSMLQSSALPQRPSCFLFRPIPVPNVGISLTSLGPCVNFFHFYCMTQIWDTVLLNPFPIEVKHMPNYFLTCILSQNQLQNSLSICTVTALESFSLLTSDTFCYWKNCPFKK